MYENIPQWQIVNYPEVEQRKMAIEWLEKYITEAEELLEKNPYSLCGAETALLDTCAVYKVIVKFLRQEPKLVPYENKSKKYEEGVFMHDLAALVGASVISRGKSYEDHDSNKCVASDVCPICYTYNYIESKPDKIVCHKCGNVLKCTYETTTYLNLHEIEDEEPW